MDADAWAQGSGGADVWGSSGGDESKTAEAGFRDALAALPHRHELEAQLGVDLGGIKRRRP
jgi:hypothetical protein